MIQNHRGGEKSTILILIFLIFFITKSGATQLDLCRHLLDRTSFGVTKKSLNDCLHDANYETTVKHLLGQSTFNHSTTAIPPFARTILRPPKPYKKLAVEERKAFQKDKRQKQIALKEWWIRKMLNTSDPFRERMVLFWHNHFTSSLRKVQQPALLYLQNELFRRYALGNFGQLLHRIVEDPAMLVYLDNRTNRKKHPNENLGREFLELFALGEGHYSESDIKALSRALTGYGLNRQMRFRFHPGQHDNGIKSFLGYRGRYNAHQAIDLILQQNETALFIVRKFWKAFIDDSPNEREVQRIAKIFRQSKYEIRPMLYALFTSPFFTAPYNRGTLVKSPVDLVIGTLRTFNEKDFDPRIVMQYCRRLGQDLFDPPNVKGWPGGQKWIDANTLLLRKEFLSRLTRGKAMLRLDKRLFHDPKIAKTSEEAACKTLLPMPVFLIPARTFDATLQTILQHPLYQLK